MSGCGGCSSDKQLTEIERQPVPEGTTVVKLTDKAIEKVKFFMKEENKSDYALRIVVAPGGCAGYQYGMDFDTPKESDIVLEQHGLKIIVDKNSAEHLTGTTIDFADGLHETGFKINNPNAQQSCGCGKSFN